MRERFRKKKEKEKKRKKTINQEDQMLELTFNFHGALSILTFSENELTIFTKRKKKERKRKKRSEMRRKEKKRKDRKVFI